MAMSRFFGGTCVTSLSPIRMLPAVTSSRPASARRDVDLPQPEGPTRTRNSPSAMSRSSALTEGLSAPGYCTVAWSYVMAAMRVLSADAVRPAPECVETCGNPQVDGPTDASGEHCHARVVHATGVEFRYRAVTLGGQFGPLSRGSSKRRTGPEIS